MSQTVSLDFLPPLNYTNGCFVSLLYLYSLMNWPFSVWKLNSLLAMKRPYAMNKYLYMENIMFKLERKGLLELNIIQLYKGKINIQINVRLSMSNWKISTWNRAIRQRKLKCFVSCLFLHDWIFFMFSSVYTRASRFVSLMLEWLFVSHINNILLNNFPGRGLVPGNEDPYLSHSHTASLKIRVQAGDQLCYHALSHVL